MKFTRLIIAMIGALPCVTTLAQSPVLKENTNGLGPAYWSNVTGTIQDNGTNRFIIVNTPAGNRFYRLVKP